MNVVFSFIDHSGDLFHVDLDMVDVKLVQELLEQVLKVADRSL
jgi:hypothetical protein